jgi:hypothetical protein
MSFGSAMDRADLSHQHRPRAFAANHFNSIFPLQNVSTLELQVVFG